MASPAAGLAQKIDAQLECPICNDRYKTPKVLVCLHSFCQECLEKLVRHHQAHSLRPSNPEDKSPKPAINCPLCRCATDVPSNGVEGLQTNFTLSNIVEVMDIHDTEGEKAPASAKTCENGLDSNPAVVHCFDCRCFLCQTCLENHKKMKATKHHRCVSLQEIKEDVRKMEQKRYCAEHEGEELRLYCKTCREVICRDCTIVTHKTHDYTFIKDVRDELVKEMQQLLEKVEAKEVEFAGHQAHLQNVETMNEESIKQCRQMVNQFFAYWIQRLHAKEQELLQQTEVFSGKISKHVMSENDAVHLMIGQMGSAIAFTRQLLDSGTPVDIAMMSKRTCKQLSIVQQLEWDPKGVRPSNYSFVSNDTNPLTVNVCRRIHPNDIVVKGLEQPILGKNTFNIEVLGVGVVVVTVEDANGERMGNPQVMKKGVRKWTATYIIPRDGHYKISVSVDGVEAKGGPFKKAWMSRLPRGTKVRRGRDWNLLYGNQDGEPFSTGVVQSVCQGSWVSVKWGNGDVNSYRWGNHGYYDLEIVPCE